MNPTRETAWKGRLPALTPLLVRWLLGSLFVYMGLQKALHPVEFLKLLRQYDLVQSHLSMNLIAATLPWFEVGCGLLLIAGMAVRGTALVLFVMLVSFTAMVTKRALAIHAAGGGAFCAIQFDCGCGTGAVFICRKLMENLLLALLAAALVWQRDVTVLQPNPRTSD